MTALQHARADYELSKYLQLFQADQELHPAGNATLRGSINGRIELAIVRLAVYGMFIVLTDTERLQFVAGGHRADAGDHLSPIQFDTGNDTWLRIGESDRSIWASLFQEVIAFDEPEPNPGTSKAFSIANLGQDSRTANISAAPSEISYSFFAALPLASKNGEKIGAICMLDRAGRPPLSTVEIDILKDTERRCSELLELARERGYHKRWSATQRELDAFLRTPSLHHQLSKGPQTPAALKTSRQEGTANKAKEKQSEIPLSGLGDPPVNGGESQRLADAEIRRNHTIVAHDNYELAQQPLSDRHDHNGEQWLPNSETTYRKVFRRAAECLRSALEADGVLFVDGLLGFHGDVQPVAEPEQELYRELARPSVVGGNDVESSSETHNHQATGSPLTHSRLYTSAEYLKGVYVERPAEILGLAGSCEDLRMTHVSKSTLGLPDIDEGFLQRLMDRHPNGAVWYSFNSKFTQVEDEVLVEIDLEEEAHRLGSTFENVQQVIFKPLTDPASRKRLGACIVWRKQSIPVFTDIVDLGSVKAFMQVVESEIARCDASHVAKQKETFVSSVSHELRTPLHGILGAVQLLDESNLDPMQRSLAKVITTSGSTLHETLTSVLSYAKINQFERRQHEYRQRHPPDTVWALADKDGLASGPDRDYEGLYICTNLAMLCEETLGVLEAGKSFIVQRGDDVIVVCNIEHQENWSYYTEPGAVRRIAVNLIGNALKYTKSGSVVVTLSATKLIEDERRVSNDLTSGRTVTFTVKDTGRGIGKEFMDSQLFLPFTQEDSTTSHGVGLGMSIVKSLVSLLGGEIEVHSQEQRGTEINVKIPMRMCTLDDDDEKGHAALQFERDIMTIRDRRITTVIYGFPEHVRQSLTNYLRDWYGCTIQEPTKDAKPDIVLVDEGNEEVLKAVKETAPIYGKQGVLLSIVMVPSRLGKKMAMIDGYIKWERVPRPLGPNNVAQGLLSCFKKLDELQEFGENASVDKQETDEKRQSHKEPANQQERKGSLSIEQYMPSLEKLQISVAPQSSSPESETSKPSSDSLKPSGKEKHPSTASEVLGKSDYQTTEPELDLSPTLRILLVDDNALNLRLLGAFFKKNGYRDTQQAKNGKEAVEAVSNSAQGFDIIFMDLSMPVMNGFEATRLIRQMESGYGRASTTGDSVIIALTGLASREDEHEAFNAGVDLFLTKPVQFPKLSKLLHQ
ncbi:sensor histidine kinase response [Stagonosporopsis vannaccii]|nr:sensor histidine kinase response [Stagonosporopsis vannaccii]